MSLEEVTIEDPEHEQGQQSATKSRWLNVNQWRDNAAFQASQSLTKSLFQRKYTLPDKTVASQLLMYRQLLHTSCKPGLKLSRDYQGTPAQRAVLDMPWWEAGIETTRKMVISYDNLLTRLWKNGVKDATLDPETNLPPVPHPDWVDQLGFQQPDPVTDFRSGGVLSMGMLVYTVESCRQTIVQRFQAHQILPMGITCINITDMLAKFLMLTKKIDKMDALLSQKPFWRMFADPHAILVLQELSTILLLDVVEELILERQTLYDTPEEQKVTVFDFAEILEKTERRVRDDLLGSGPRTIAELRQSFVKLQVQYQQQLDRKLTKALFAKTSDKSGTAAPNVLGAAASGMASGAQTMATGVASGAQTVKVGAQTVATGMASGAHSVAVKTQSMASTVFSRIPFGKKEDSATANADESTPEPQPTIVSLPPPSDEETPPPEAKPTPTEAAGDQKEQDVADDIQHFSIDDDDDL